MLRRRLWRRNILRHTTGVGSANVVVFGFVLTVLSLVALLACYLPARSAMRVNPLESLAAD